MDMKFIVLMILCFVLGCCIGQADFDRKAEMSSNCICKE